MDTPRSDPHTELVVADAERRRLLDRLRESDPLAYILYLQCTAPGLEDAEGITYLAGNAAARYGGPVKMTTFVGIQINLSPYGDDTDVTDRSRWRIELEGAPGSPWVAKNLDDPSLTSEHAEFDDAFDWVISTAGTIS